MAGIIVKGLEMPSDCISCDLRGLHKSVGCERYQNADTPDVREDGCPFQSVDELIEKLNEEKGVIISRERDKTDGYKNGLERAIEISKEFCGIEN